MNASGNYTRLGTVHRNEFYGPGYSSANVSLFKDFPITGRVISQFRAQVYNLGNSPAFLNPANTQLVSGNAANNNNFAVLNEARYRSERELELAFRVTF